MKIFVLIREDNSTSIAEIDVVDVFFNEVSAREAMSNLNRSSNSEEFYNIWEKESVDEPNLDEIMRGRARET
jgi:hypothetical protein